MNKLKRLVKLTKGIRILQKSLERYMNEYSKDNDVTMENLKKLVELLLIEELNSQTNI
jgi:hypothetical protein